MFIENSLVVTVPETPSLSVLPCSECSVTVYVVSGCRFGTVYWVSSGRILSSVGEVESSVVM